MSKLSLVGTSNWRSFAYFRSGARLERQGDPDRALEMYHRALASDVHNRGARVNLASLLIDDGENHGAIEQLERVKLESSMEALTTAEQEHAISAVQDPVWYSASYRLALAYYNIGRKEDARREAGILLERVRAGLQQPQDPKQPHPTPALRHYLESVEPAVNIMLIGLSAGDLAQSEHQLEAVDRTIPSPEVQYNLACTCSLLAAATRDSEKRKSFEEQVLHHLEFALRLSPAMAAWARRDPSLSYVRKSSGRRFEDVIARHEKKSPK